MLDHSNLYPTASNNRVEMKLFFISSSLIVLIKATFNPDCSDSILPRNLVYTGNLLGSKNSARISFLVTYKDRNGVEPPQIVGSSCASASFMGEPIANYTRQRCPDVPGINSCSVGVVYSDEYVHEPSYDLIVIWLNVTNEIPSMTQWLCTKFNINESMKAVLFKSVICTIAPNETNAEIDFKTHWNKIIIKRTHYPAYYYILIPITISAIFLAILYGNAVVGGKTSQSSVAPPPTRITVRPAESR